MPVFCGLFLHLRRKRCQKTSKLETNFGAASFDLAITTAQISPTRICLHEPWVTFTLFIGSTESVISYERFVTFLLIETGNEALPVGFVISRDSTRSAYTVGLRFILKHLDNVTYQVMQVWNLFLFLLWLMIRLYIENQLLTSFRMLRHFFVYSTFSKQFDATYTECRVASIWKTTRR